MGTCVLLSFVHCALVCRRSHVCVRGRVMSAVAGRQATERCREALTLLTYFSLPPPHSWRRASAADQMPAIPVTFMLLRHSPITTVLPFQFVLCFATKQDHRNIPWWGREDAARVCAVCAPCLSFVQSCRVSSGKLWVGSSSHVQLKVLQLRTQ